MNISYDVTATLRADMKHHEPIVLIFDARGNGGGYDMPNNHGRPPEQGDGLHGPDRDGQPIIFRDEQTIKLDGGALRTPFFPATTRTNSV